MRQTVELDTPFLRISAQDNFTLRDAVQGVCIMGGIGSGKTSGSGHALALSYLRAGMGGLILCAKPEERRLWEQYCADAGRSASLIVFDGSRPGFNFIAYELARQGADGLNSVVECLMRVIEAARAAGASPGRGGDAFWEDTTRQVLRHTIPVLFAAKGTVTIPEIIAFVRTAPRTPEEMSDRAWQGQSFFYATFAEASRQLDDRAGEKMASFWRNEFATLDAKTRGNIAISLTTTLDRFNHGWLQTAFCTETTIVPELCFHGAIIVLDMPALTRNEDGIVGQQLFKYMWQRAVLARNALTWEQSERPVFLWADEAQYFINSYDAEFLSTCRGSRACTVFLSQSLPTYFARMPGEQSRERVHQLLGNFATRIWHSNACHETNRWAADTVGQVLHRRANFSEGEGRNQSFGMNMGEGENWSRNSGGSVSSSYGGGASGASRGQTWGTSHGGNDNHGRNRGHGSSRNVSHGYAEQMGYVIEPAAFGRMLKTGGPANAGRVSAVWYQAGRQFRASGGNTLLAEFQQ